MNKNSLVKANTATVIKDEDELSVVIVISASPVNNVLGTFYAVRVTDLPMVNSSRIKWLTVSIESVVRPFSFHDLDSFCSTEQLKDYKEALNQIAYDWAVEDKTPFYDNAMFMELYRQWKPPTLEIV
jgi:hypothetical protein